MKYYMSYQSIAKFYEKLQIAVWSAGMAGAQPAAASPGALRAGGDFRFKLGGPGTRAAHKLEPRFRLAKCSPTKYR